MACAKLLRPPRDLNVGRAKRFAQFRIAKVSHFARYTVYCRQSTALGYIRPFKATDTMCLRCCSFCNNELLFTATSYGCHERQVITTHHEREYIVGVLLSS